jgi:hypothetical protein
MRGVAQGRAECRVPGVAANLRPVLHLVDLPRLRASLAEGWQGAPVRTTERLMNHVITVT